MPGPTGFLDFSKRSEWRQWLAANHRAAEEAWLVFYKKGSAETTLTLDEAVEEAVCFGWIDGKLKSLDQERYALRFTPRKPGSIWSMSNIRRVEKLTAAGLMTPAGLEAVAEAHAIGRWEAAIRREQVDLIPPELEKALRRRKGALAAYRDLPPSRRKQLLYWLQSAKRPETVKKRIESIVAEVAG